MVIFKDIVFISAPWIELWLSKVVYATYPKNLEDTTPTSTLKPGKIHECECDEWQSSLVFPV